MVLKRSLEILRQGHGSPFEGFEHDDRIEDKIAEHDAQREDDVGRIASQLPCLKRSGLEVRDGHVQQRTVGGLDLGHRPGDQEVEERHQDPASHRQDEPLGPAAALLAGKLAVGQRVEHDRYGNQGHAAKKQQGIAGSLRDVVDQDPQHQGQADSDGKGDRHAGDGDGRHQKDIGGVENDSAQKGRAEVGQIGLTEIFQEPAPGIAETAQSEGEDQCHQEHAEHVVPIEQLKPPPPSGQLLRIGPRSPTDHRDHAEKHGHRVAFEYEHGL